MFIDFDVHKNRSIFEVGRPCKKNQADQQSRCQHLAVVITSYSIHYTKLYDNRLLRRVRDYAEVRASGEITRDVADAALAMLDVDSDGLDRNNFV